LCHFYRYISNILYTASQTKTVLSQVQSWLRPHLQHTKILISAFVTKMYYTIHFLNFSHSLRSNTICLRRLEDVQFWWSVTIGKNLEFIHKSWYQNFCMLKVRSSLAFYPVKRFFCLISEVLEKFFDFTVLVFKLLYLNTMNRNRPHITSFICTYNNIKASSHAVIFYCSKRNKKF